MANEVISNAVVLMEKLEQTQSENIGRAADCVVEALLRGGILQAFGCGHSLAGALELCHRAGGLVPTKLIREPAYGDYETVEGVGNLLMKKVEILENDVVFVISHSGRNPLPIEVCLESQRRGAKVVAVTAVGASRQSHSRHSSGKLLYELADIVIDTGAPFGDAAIKLEGLDTKICGMSSILTVTALQWTVLEVAKKMLIKGIEPPFYKSQNLDGGHEYNDQMMNRYLSRIWHL